MSCWHIQYINISLSKKKATPVKSRVCMENVNRPDAVIYLPILAHLAFGEIAAVILKAATTMKQFTWLYIRI